MLMSERPTIAVPAAIQEAQLQFENWRRERKRGERIPENLWAMAVELAKQHGVWPAARALHLDHGRLKRRVFSAGVRKDKPGQLAAEAGTKPASISE
jgi:hypothetical protein